jgi:hypothetical protein
MFKQYLRWLIGDNYYEQIDPNADLEHVSSHTAEGEAMRSLMKQFTMHKKAFHRKTETMSLDLPYPLDKLNIPGKVHSGEITITK